MDPKCYATMINALFNMKRTRIDVPLEAIQIVEKFMEKNVKLL